MHSHLSEYFKTSLSRFDANKNKAFSISEFNNYQNAMTAKIREIVDKYAPTEKMLEDREEAKQVASSAEKEAQEAEMQELASLKLNPKSPIVSKYSLQ